MLNNCPECIHRAVCETQEVVENRQLVCKMYEKEPPITLNDKINQMTPEEKAEWLWNHDETTEKLGRLTKDSLLSFLTKPIEDFI